MNGHQACAAAGVGGPRSGSDGVPRAARCLVVIGTRREAITLFPIVHALEQSPYFDPFVVVTSQAAARYEQVLDMAGIAADADLRCDSHGRTVNHVIAGVVSRFDDLLTRLRGGPERRRRPRLAGLGAGTAAFPSAAIVHGSSTSSLGAALAATGAMVPVVHVEPDDRGRLLTPGTADFNRRLVSRLASFHTTPTSAGLCRLAAEGVTADRVFVTGDTRIDAFRWAAARGQAWPNARLKELDQPARTVLLADIGRHRRRLGSFADALGQVAAVRPDAIVVLPLSPDPQVRAAILPPLTGLRNVIMLEPLEYAAYARLVQRADLAISDSPAMQEEGPAVGTPVLAIGTGCRREGVEAGWVRSVGSDPLAMTDHAIRLLDRAAAYDRMRAAPNPFGDGAAAGRVVAALEHLIFDTPPPVPFGGGFSRRRVLEAAGYGETGVAAVEPPPLRTPTLVSIQRSRV